MDLARRAARVAHLETRDLHPSFDDINFTSCVNHEAVQEARASIRATSERRASSAPSTPCGFIPPVPPECQGRNTGIANVDRPSGLPTPSHQTFLEDQIQLLNVSISRAQSANERS